MEIYIQWIYKKAVLCKLSLIHPDLYLWLLSAHEKLKTWLHFKVQFENTYFLNSLKYPMQ